MSLIKDVINELDHFNSDPKKMRTFGIILGSVLILSVLYGYFKGKPSSYIELKIGIAISLYLLAFSVPRAFKYPLQIWMSFALSIGWIMSRVILSLLYFLILTPLASISRLFGKQYLVMDFKQNSESSYWVPLKTQYKKEDFQKMYYQ